MHIQKAVSLQECAPKLWRTYVSQFNSQCGALMASKCIRLPLLSISHSAATPTDREGPKKGLFKPKHIGPANKFVASHARFY